MRTQQAASIQPWVLSPQGPVAFCECVSHGRRLGTHGCGPTCDRIRRIPGCHRRLHRVRCQMEAQGSRLWRGAAQQHCYATPQQPALDAPPIPRPLDPLAPRWSSTSCCAVIVTVNTCQDFHVWRPDMLTWGFGDLGGGHRGVCNLPCFFLQVLCKCYTRRHAGAVLDPAGMQSTQLLLAQRDTHVPHALMHRHR